MPTDIISEILSDIRKKLNFDKIMLRDIRIGLRYTIVELTGGFSGIAFSYANEIFVENSPMTPGSMIGSPLSKILHDKSNEKTTIESVIKTAIINALTNTNEVKGISRDLLEVIKFKKDDIVCMIGAIHPFIQKIEKQVKELLIFERNRESHTRYLPDWAAPYYLENADVILFTGASLINKTFDMLVKYAKNAREIVVVGPSTPLYPAPFKKRKVTLLGGIVITDVELAKRIISEAGGTHHLKPAYRKVVLRVEDS